MTTSPLEPQATVECAHCTVLTDRPDGLCPFCTSYAPPAVDEHRHDPNDPRLTCEQCIAYNPVVTGALLDSAANHATMSVEDIGDQLTALPAGASMWLAVDLVRARRHLRAAVRLIEQVGTQLDTQVVAL
jgi:hypothetical protein